MKVLWRHFLMNDVAIISLSHINAHGIRRIRFRFDHIGPSVLVISVPLHPWAEVRPRWNRRGCGVQVIGR